MSIIKLKAKVKLMSEEDMELESDLNINNPKSARWVWRNMAFSVDEISKLISYSSDKTIIILHTGERLLTKEPFEQLYDLWIDNLPEDLDLSSSEEDFEISGDET